MPNWCFNTINVSGPRHEVKKFLKAVSSNQENRHLDFNGVVPMPEEIRDTNSPNLNEELSKILIKKYGSEDWYSWTLKNWGTKWNPECLDGWDETFSEENKTLDITINCQTAWSPPTEFLINASKIYPALVFSNDFYEEGNCFVGQYEIKYGEFLIKNEPDWDSKEGVALRQDFGIYNEEEVND